MLDFLNTDILLQILIFFNIILLISVIVSNIRIKKIKQDSNEFMKKLGEGKDISEILNNYMDRVINLEEALSETNVYCKQIDKRQKDCIQKIGIVRYNAYKDTGSDLSFALALLDDKNNGIVLNGIYSREMSNIYAKPILDGKSNYTMTDEEKEAVDKAIKDEGIRKLN